jgi:precorrin-6B methylase 2
MSEVRQEGTPDRAVCSAMLQLISGFGISQALYTAAALRLADLMKTEPQSSDDLARRTDTHPRSLHRLLRALASVGVFSEEHDGRFGLTPLGATLRSDVPGSLRAWAQVALGEESRIAWSSLPHTVRTGEIAFEHVFGCDVWQYRARHPETAKIFDQAMAGTQAVYNAAVLASYPFERHSTVTDVGGGNGSFMIALLQAKPEPSGVVFDLPHVIEEARSSITEAGLAKRCRVIAGDAFASVPRGGDAYVLSRVLHDWADDRAIAILRSCREAMSGSGKLLLIERILPTRVHAGAAAQALLTTDLHMMVMNGGCERTEDDYRGLLNKAGFEQTRIYPTPSPMNVIEATPI